MADEQEKSPSTGPRRVPLGGCNVHVVEHPHFAQLDFELRALLERQAAAPMTDTILTFFDRSNRSFTQVVVVYRPSERLLKRLVLAGDGQDQQSSRLEIWRDIGLGEIGGLIESAFLEKTRPLTLQPEVFLGRLETLIERGGI
jgi:hypothetical protein